MDLLPKSCIVDRAIPKNKFYKKLEVSSSLRKMFISYIDKIIWRYKIAESTVNISKTAEIEEIQVIEVILKDNKDISKILEKIDMEIPYPILFLINYNDKYKLKIAKKRRNQMDKDSFVIDIYFETDFLPIEKIKLDILNGIDLSKVYENIFNIFIDRENNDLSFEDNVVKYKEKIKLKKEIEKLGNKIRNEKQFNIKVDLNIELQKLKGKLIDDNGSKNE